MEKNGGLEIRRVEGVGQGKRTEKDGERGNREGGGGDQHWEHGLGSRPCVRRARLCADWKMNAPEC